MVIDEVGCCKGIHDAIMGIMGLFGFPTMV